MISSPSFLVYILAFLAVIGPLVFVHEMGHYWAARWCGVKIEAFSIGMGREVAGWTDKHGTRWKLAWLPIGGYVRFAGDMNAVSQPTPEWLALPAAERQRTFQAKPVWQRAIIVAAGPAVNFVVAFLILAGFAIAYGETRTPTVVQSVQGGSAAESAGLQGGDKILAVDGRATPWFNDVVMQVTTRPGFVVTIDYERGGERRVTTAKLNQRVFKDRFGNEQKVGELGVLRGPDVRLPVSLSEAPGVAVRRVQSIVELTATGLWQIITGRRSVKELGGPLKIAKTSGEQLSLGWNEFVTLVALVSINLGFINLLPIPMLDGGHLFFYAIEAVRRRPVAARVQEWAYRGGLAALLTLMLLVTVNDLGSFGLWQRLGSLFG